MHSQGEIEKKYPIYKIQAWWNQDDYQNNSIGFNKMYREDPEINQARQDTIEWWEDFIRTENPRTKVILLSKNPQLIRLECVFYEWETWCITWFSHYTYNVYLSDQKLLESFASFVDRKLPLHMNLNISHEICKREGIKTYCLMGAEDRWRWKGPCHCEHCQKFGITRIDH